MQSRSKRIGLGQQLVALMLLAVAVAMAWGGLNTGRTLVVCGLLLGAWAQTYFPGPGFRRTLPGTFRWYRQEGRVTPRFALVVMAVGAVFMVAGEIYSLTHPFG